MSPTADHADPTAGASPGRSSSRRGLGLLVALILVAGAAITTAACHDQIWAALTHRKGGPAHTAALEPVPSSGPPALRLAAAGDVGESGDRLEAAAHAMESAEPDPPYDVLLLLGDNVYPDGDPARLQETVFRPFAPVLDAGATLLAILGNHDVRKGHGDAQMRALGMPGRWWSRSFGDVQIVGLDSNEPDDTEQLRFLKAKLAASNARWKIVALHHPPYSAGYHGSSRAVRRAFSPLFERYGVQLVLSGHDHDYQRSKPVNGVTYVVSGGGSRVRRTGEADFTAVSWAAQNFLDITFFGDRLVLRAITTDERVADDVTIHP